MTTVGVTTIRRAARDGDEGIGISSVVTTFAACNYATEDEVKANASSLTWLTKCPSVGADIKYVWKRTIISFTRDKASVTTYELVATYIFANGDDILGPLVLCKELWVSGTEYVNNDSQIDVFYVVGSDGKRHWFKVRDGIASNSTNKTISPLEDTQGVIYTEAGSLAAFFSAQLLLAENCYLRCVSGGRFFIGETNNSVSGWLITEGAISYVKSDGTYGVQLTKDGYINDPDGLHFKVGGAIKKNTINLMPDPIFKDYAFGSANKSQLYYQRLANIDGLISPWYEDGGLMNFLYVRESSTSAMTCYVNAGDNPRIRIETGKDYVFSVWVNTYLATSLEEFISTKISEISFYNSEDGVNDYSNRALRINLLYNSGTVKAYINGKSSKTKFAECLGVVGERGVWKQIAVKFNIPSNADVYLSSSTTKYTTYGTEAWLSWLPLIDVIANKSQCGIIYAACQLEQGATPSALEYDYYAVTRGSLLETGIDISAGQIKLTSNNLVCENNSGEQTIWIDNLGNLSTRGTQTQMYQKVTTLGKFLDMFVVNPCANEDSDTHELAVPVDGSYSGNTWKEDAAYYSTCKVDNTAIEGIAPIGTLSPMSGGQTTPGVYLSLDMRSASGMIDIAYTPTRYELNARTLTQSQNIGIVLPYIKEVSSLIEGQTGTPVLSTEFCRTVTTMFGDKHFITLEELKSLVGRKMTIKNSTSKTIFINTPNSDLSCMAIMPECYATFDFVCESSYANPENGALWKITNSLVGLLPCYYWKRLEDATAYDIPASQIQSNQQLFGEGLTL